MQSTAKYKGTQQNAEERHENVSDTNETGSDGDAILAQWKQMKDDEDTPIANEKGNNQQPIRNGTETERMTRHQRENISKNYEYLKTNIKRMITM